MKRTHVLAAILALATLATLPTAASAYYHAHVGRFIQRDPIEYAAGDKNLYRYVGDAPTNARDPFGLQLASDKGIPFGLSQSIGRSLAAAKTPAEYTTAVRRAIETIALVTGTTLTAQQVAELVEAPPPPIAVPRPRPVRPPTTTRPPVAPRPPIWRPPVRPRPRVDPRVPVAPPPPPLSDEEIDDMLWPDEEEGEWSEDTEPVPDGLLYYDPRIESRSSGETCETEFPGWKRCEEFSYGRYEECRNARFPMGSSTKSRKHATGCGAGGGWHYLMQDRCGNPLSSIVCCKCCRMTITGKPVEGLGCDVWEKK